MIKDRRRAIINASTPLKSLDYSMNLDLEDLSVSDAESCDLRMFQIGQGQRLEIRAEAFNVTDSLRLGNPIVVLNDARFGQIRSSNGGPRIIQLALKYVF